MIKKGIYSHYKGKEYEVLGVARHSETLEELVVYKALYSIDEFGEEFKGEPIFVRPKEMFEEEIELNGKKLKRFEFVDL
ncbi:MAG: DUF1653 domain-containing protein [Nanoarchaeota archaeon]|nr:DUF1653 domain-containing protein [Nanoarchaeota archaeon]